MKTLFLRPMRRLLAILAVSAGVGGCAVYAPPYAYDTGYSGYGYGYGYPTYVTPPVSIGLGLGYYSEHRHGGYRSHGWHGPRHGYHRGYRHGGRR